MSGPFLLVSLETDITFNLSMRITICDTENGKARCSFNIIYHMIRKQSTCKQAMVMQRSSKKRYYAPVWLKLLYILLFALFYTSDCV